MREDEVCAHIASGIKLRKRDIRSLCTKHRPISALVMKAYIEILRQQHKNVGLIFERDQLDLNESGWNKFSDFLL